ncbi:MAG TPA: hypothetical protein VGF40_12875 [Thermoanaerobaculia bacterium]
MKPIADDVLFREEQRFDRGWFWLIILTAGLPIATIFGLGLWQQLGRGIPFGTNPVDDGALIAISIVAFAIAGAVAWLMAAARLETEVRRGILSLRYRPFHRMTIPVSRIVRSEVRRYRPIAEFGGWGIRYGFGAGWAWNVSGTMGVQLELENGRKILVGSQRPDELNAALARAR